MKIRINKSFGDFIVGQIVNVPDNGKGTPLNIYWRKRLNDAAQDGCCEVVKRISKPKSKPKPEAKAMDEPKPEKGKSTEEGDS